MTLHARLQRLEQRLVSTPNAKTEANAAKEADFDFEAFAALIEEYTAGLPPDELAEWTRRTEETMRGLDRAREMRP